MATEPFNTYVLTLTSATSVAGTDVVYVNQGGLSRRATITQAASPIGGLPWINVKDSPYNATGTGVTDDTAAINLAIAALNTATKGVLYFPAGTYLVSSSLTTITANGIIRGDGMSVFASSGQIKGPISQISFTSTSTSLFTTNYTDNNYLMFTDLALFYASVTQPTAGAAITVTANVSGGGQKVDYRNISVIGFYNCIDVQTGFQWTMDNCLIHDPVNYGIRIRNINFPDSGDWNISNSAFYADQRAAPAAIRIETSGGGKIVNTKINVDGSNEYVKGIDIAGTNVTEDLLVSNCSIENITGVGINSTQWNGLIIDGCQFGGVTTHNIAISSSSNISIMGVTTSFGSAGSVTLTSCNDYSVAGLTNTTLTISGGSITNQGTDVKTTSFGGGGSGVYQGCVSGGTGVFPGTFGVTSTGRTDVFADAATGQISTYTFSTAGSASWFLIADGTAGTFQIYGGTINSGSQVLTCGATIGSNFALTNRKLVAAASTTTAASLNLPSGTAPTSPADGDMWYDGTNIKFQIGASTKTFTLI